MKILFLLGNFYKQCGGGAEYQAYLIAKCLSRQHSVSYIYVNNNNGWLASECDGISLHPIRKRPLARRLMGKPFILDYHRLQKMFEKIQPDVIYTRGGTAFTGMVARYARSNNCKVVWHIASEFDVKPQWYRSMRTVLLDYVDKKVLEYGIRNIDFIIGQADYQDRLLQENYGRRCNMVIGNLHPVPCKPFDKNELIQVLWISNIKKNKQPEKFIKLVRTLQSAQHVRFIMIGRQGNKFYQDTLERRLQGLDNLQYRGYLPIDEVNDILAQSHILVNTSRHEGFPNTFIQAWMRCVPVVSLHVDPDEVLKKREIGFHSGSFENVVRDVRCLIEDKDLRCRMGDRAREYAIENHGLETGSEKIRGLFNSLL